MRMVEFATSSSVTWLKGCRRAWLYAMWPSCPHPPRVISTGRSSRASRTRSIVPKQPVPLRLRNRELRSDAAIEVLFREGAEVIRVIPRKRATLPIEAFVHVEDRQLAQRDVSRIHNLGERLVPACRPAGYDGR